MLYGDPDRLQHFCKYIPPGEDNSPRPGRMMLATPRTMVLISTLGMRIVHGGSR